MPSAVPVALTKTRSIVKFSAGNHNRYRLSKIDRSARLPKIENANSGHCRLRHHKPPMKSFKDILGIIWDDDTANWRDSLTQIDPERTLVLVLWKGIDHPVWEHAIDITSAAPALNAKFWSEIALQQEERFEADVIVLRTRGNNESGSYVEKGALSNH